MNVFLIDDDDYWHSDAARKLKNVGYQGKLRCFYGAHDYFSETTEEERRKALIVVDFDLDSHDAVSEKIAERIRDDKSFSGKIVLCSLLNDFGMDNEIVQKSYNQIIRKNRLDWESLLLKAKEA